MDQLDSRESAQSTSGYLSADFDSHGDTAHGREPQKPFEKWRRTAGLLLLALVIFTWTATNFLASAVLADDSFSKPFFVSYLNTSFFILPLIPALIHKAYRQPEELREWARQSKQSIKGVFTRVLRFRGQHTARANGRYSPRKNRSLEESRERLLGDPLEDAERLRFNDRPTNTGTTEQLSLAQTARLGVEFSFLWFAASFLLLACLEHTTVASSTILTSTSSVFTLLFGYITGVETFTVRKLTGVLASLAGVILISSVDWSGKTSDDEHRGQFPDKSAGELALGNALALLSAIVYGVYVIFMKKRIDDESKVNMPTFFGFVGLTNVLLMWPGFFVLHYTGWEVFELPSAGRVTWILLLNALGSMLSDIAWAYAVLLTSPILVTVGLGLNIPLSLLGQIVLNGQTTTSLYWVGAIIVLASFIVVN